MNGGFPTSMCRGTPSVRRRRVGLADRVDAAVLVVAEEQLAVDVFAERGDAESGLGKDAGDPGAILLAQAPDCAGAPVGIEIRSLQA